jgi:chromosome segregation ATPase
MAESKVKNLTTGKIVTLLAVVALAAAVTVLLIQNLNLRSEVAEGIVTEEQLTSEIENVEQQLKDLEFAMNTKDLEVEQKEAMLEQKESLIQEQEAKIANLLARNRISQQEAERLRGRVEQLEYYVKKYEGQIAELKEEIAIRDAQIASLTDSLGNVASERDSIRDKSTYQGIQLEGARKLTAHSFKFFRKKQSGAEEEEAVFRASQMEEIKICMVIAENNTTKKGEKNVYIRILDPSGNLVQNPSTSGFFKYSGEDIQYTSMSKIVYEGEQLPACVNFKQPDGYDYQDGMYKVLAYCEDRIIGKAEFEVK